MRILSVITLLAALVLPSIASAEVQTFAATYTYIMGDDDSRNRARQKCLAEAKRKILEQVGVYLARIIHERFCCNRGFAATTSLSAGGLAARSVDILFKDASLPHGSTRPSRVVTPHFRDEPS